MRTLEILGGLAVVLALIWISWGYRIHTEPRPRPDFTRPSEQTQAETMPPEAFFAGITVTEQGETLLLTNLTDAPIGPIRIYYREVCAETGAFLGERTYSMVLPRLEAGESRFLFPSHYIPGRSKVVAVTAEPT